MNGRGRGRKKWTGQTTPPPTATITIKRERERGNYWAVNEKLMLDPCPLFIDFVFVLFDFVFVIGRFTRFSKQQQRPQRQWQRATAVAGSAAAVTLTQHRSCTPHPMQSNPIHTLHTSSKSTVNATMALLHILLLFILYKWRRWRLDIALNHCRTLKRSRSIIHTQLARSPRSQTHTHTFLHGPPKSVFHVYLIAFRSRLIKVYFPMLYSVQSSLIRLTLCVFALIFDGCVSERRLLQSTWIVCQIDGISVQTA